MKRLQFYNYFTKQFAECATYETANRKLTKYTVAIDGYVEDIVASKKISETLYRAYWEQMRRISAMNDRIVARRERA